MTVILICVPCKKTAGVNGSLLSLGKTVARSLTIFFSLLSLNLYMRRHVRRTPKAPNFIGVIKRRFIRLRSGEGKMRARMACAYVGFLFLLPSPLSPPPL